MGLARPVSRFEPTKARGIDGVETDISIYKHHLLCDEDGRCPADLNEWERKVVVAESKRLGLNSIKLRARK